MLTPIELIKCKMQVPREQISTKNLTVLGLVSAIYRRQGLIGFWHGQFGTFIRETGGSAAWFGSYEGTKALFQCRRREGVGNSISELMVAGAIAGMTYNFIFYPADTIKSRMQTEEIGQTYRSRRTFWTVAKHVWTQQGLKGLYKGCGITVGRAAPSSAIIFTIYEAFSNYF